MPQPITHHPKHVYLDDTWYFISASTHHRERLLSEEKAKAMMRDKLKALVIEFEVQLAAWVILDNHYHLLIKSKVGDDLPRFVGRLHGSTSHALNQQASIRGRRVWDNYWDVCMRTERDYWTRFNYIHHNPVKHGYVARMEDWAFSSYGWYLEHKGEEWLVDAFQRFPILDFSDMRDV